ncbi:MAG: hypothetical protein IPG59_13445 [Candidatus Melainabacteria bacterium]|nr:MAG: hypothetical protein IPG59_13445 [Candidatus Melainabacteria bacterium]
MTNIDSLKVTIGDAISKGLADRDSEANAHMGPLVLDGDRLERFIKVLHRKVYECARTYKQSAVLSLTAEDMYVCDGENPESIVSGGTLQGVAAEAFSICREIGLNPTVHLIQPGDALIVIDPLN